MGNVGIHGRNFSYTIRAPVPILGNTEFKVEYHSLSKAILGRLIHWPGEKIKDVYLNDKTEKYEALMKLEPQLGLSGLYIGPRANPVVGGREITLYIQCQSKEHGPHEVQVKSLNLKDDPILLPSTGPRCDCPDCLKSTVRYTGNDVLLNCKHLEAARDILSNPLPSDLSQIRVKSCVPGTNVNILGRVHQMFGPALDPASDFGRDVVREFIDKHFFEPPNRTTDSGKVYGTWNQYECDLYFYRKHGSRLLSDKARQALGTNSGVRCGWEVSKGETGKNKRGVDPVYMNALRAAGWVQAGTVLNMEGNFSRQSLENTVAELIDPQRIMWEHLPPSSDVYVRFIPKGMFNWTRIGLPFGGSDASVVLKGDAGLGALAAKGGQGVVDPVTGAFGFELPLSNPDDIRALAGDLRALKTKYNQVLGLNPL